MGMFGLYFLWCLLTPLVVTGLVGVVSSCSFLITAITRGRGKFVVLCTNNGITMDKKFDGRIRGAMMLLLMMMMICYIFFLFGGGGRGSGGGGATVRVFVATIGAITIASA
eukprot:4272861-Ditylum_brightwellii.AAC.1